MQKFSFKEQKDLLIPTTKNMVYPKDKNGRNLSGDEFIKKMATIAATFERKFKRPVPIPNQDFVAWLKQTKRLMDEGMKFDDIMSMTVAPV